MLHGGSILAFATVALRQGVSSRPCMTVVFMHGGHVHTCLLCICWTVHTPVFDAVKSVYQIGIIYQTVFNLERCRTVRHASVLEQVQLPHGIWHCLCCTLCNAHPLLHFICRTHHALCVAYSAWHILHCVICISHSILHILCMLNP